MKYKYRLVEQEEGDEETSSGNKEKIVYDLVLTPLASSVQDAVSALEKINNYGAYVSNIRNTKSDIEKAVIDHFGPNQPFAKKKAEKERGKPFPPKTKDAIDNFIKTLSTKPSVLKWKVVGDTLVFPSVGNPTKKVTEKIISTVMDNARLDYDLENKESVSESKKNIKENLLSNKITQAIKKIDPNMSYVDFAKAVADVIKNDYGSHNIEPFIKVLNKELMTEEKVNKHNIILTLDNISLKKFKTIPTFKNLLFPNQLNSLKTGDNELTVNNTVLGTLQRIANPGGYSVKKINN